MEKAAAGSGWRAIAKAKGSVDPADLDPEDRAELAALVKEARAEHAGERLRDQWHWPLRRPSWCVASITHRDLAELHHETAQSLSKNCSGSELLGWWGRQTLPHVGRTASTGMGGLPLLGA